MPNSSVIDSSALERLQEWGGRELLRQMIYLFLKNAPERMHQIRSGIGSGNLDGAERGAHSLKSSAGNVGARELFRLGSEMEDVAADRDLGRLRELLPPLEEAYELARRELEALQGELPE